MTVRRYGPVNDAGVTITEKEGERPIVPSLYGTTCYAGVLERGPTDELIETTSKKDMIKKTGGYIPESLLPDSCVDFWDHGDGAGALLLVRVTDGNEVKALLTSYDRSDPRNAVVKWEANNGGGWGGRRDYAVADLDAVPTDITGETTVKLPDLYVVAADKWKNGYIKFSETGKSYKILSNTVGDGVTGAVVTVSGESKMLTDYASGTDKEVILSKDQTDGWGRERVLAVEIGDGEIDPTNQWSAKVYLNGEVVRSYPNLSMDQNSDDYFVKIINEDKGNVYVTVTDLWAMGVTASNRPANHYGVIPTSGVDAKELTLALVIVDDSGAGSNTIAAFTYGADVIPDTYTIEYDTTDWMVSSVRQEHHAFGNATGGVAYVAENSLSIGFTITESTPSQGEKFVVRVEPLDPDEAIGGYVYPDVDNAKNTRFRISDNTRTTVTILAGDMTTDGADGDNYRVQYAQEFEQGYDGLGALADADYTAAFDVGASLFNRMEGKGYGVGKFAIPGCYLQSGIAAATVQAAMRAYCEAKNHCFRYEVDETITDDASFRDAVNDTLGRSDFAKVCVPSYAYVTDPILRNRQKLVPLTGMIHGREAGTAKTYEGYHKAVAGEDITLPKVLELPTGDAILNGEILNPAGIQRVIKRKGNFVIWGGRAPSVDPQWRYANHREQMSYYEHVLQENYDWIIFAINDPQERPNLIASLKAYFYPEWRRKRALQGKTLDEAAQIKIDDENNTAIDSANGDLNADVGLWLADMIERFNIRIGKRGIFESVVS